MRNQPFLIMSNVFRSNKQQCLNMKIHQQPLHEKRIVSPNTEQKMKFSISKFFRKCDQIHKKLRIWLHLLNKSLMKNFIFLCSVISRCVNVVEMNSFHRVSPGILEFVETVRFNINSAPEKVGEISVFCTVNFHGLTLPSEAIAQSFKNINVEILR